ncbi:MAG: dienelactone hydrolase family protein [Planctomycetes bacterium]|nr:dienelactone hydrolase family protein [Planctomycetota bacterium]
MRLLVLALTVCLNATWVLAQDRPATVAGTQPLTADKPLDVLMVEGIDRFCLKEIDRARDQRESLWKRDYSSADAYAKSIEAQRAKFRINIGAVDQRVAPSRFEDLADLPATGLYQIRQVRWGVLPGLTAEGLLLTPNTKSTATAIVIPDARWSPEELCGAVPGDAGPLSTLPQQLVESGFRVLIPTLLSRDDEFSGNPEIAMTNQTHREWVYRSAFEVGRHVIGYEAQKILAAVDLLKLTGDGKAPLIVAGMGDGGQLALYSAALDSRIDAALVSGYFQPREGVWQEPIDRNIWGQLTEFGDAQIAGMVAPRPLIIEACAVPETDGPLPVKQGRRGGAAPGQIKVADPAAVQAEFKKAKSIYEQLKAAGHIRLVISGADGRGPAASLPAVAALAETAHHKIAAEVSAPAVRLSAPVNKSAVQQRQVNEAIEFTQKTLRHSYKTRDKLFAKADRSSVEKYVATSDALREHVYQELIGKLPDPTMPPNPRTRKVLEEKEYTGYEVVLDTYPEVIAAGILLLPTDLKPGEKRPVVVCQHGLEGVPMDTISGPGSAGYPYYKAFSAELAKRGFIVYAPQNCYRGRDLFRTLQRKSNPLRRSLFTYIIPQHLVTLRWLASLPNADKDRLAFYGLSYGGKTAVRVPPMLPPRPNDPGYCLSICSADYNEWVTKNASTDLPFSYVFTNEYEIFEWNMAHVANYAELSQLMTPRPFMVERGHDDGVGIDEWVAYEYAKVRRHYNKLGLGDKTEIEFFNGPHTINGQGTYNFLHRHLNWPQK